MYIKKIVFGCLLFLGLSGCSTFPKSPIPGDPTTAFNKKDLPVSTVITALKCQIEKGLKAIKKKNGEVAKDRKFKLKDGTAEITIQAILAGNGQGKVNYILPTGGEDTTTPEFSETRVATEKRTIVREFGIETGDTSGESICDHKRLKDLAMEDFIKDQMIAAFTDTLDVPRQSTGKPYNPKFTDNSMSFEINFKAERKRAGSLAAEIITAGGMPAETLGPSFELKSDRTAENTVLLTFPMLASDSGDSRKFYVTVGPLGVSYSLEQPYVEKKHAKYLKVDPALIKSPPDAITFFRKEDGAEELREFDTLGLGDVDKKEGTVKRLPLPIEEGPDSF
jgi:hypothetical protein